MDDQSKGTVIQFPIDVLVESDSKLVEEIPKRILNLITDYKRHHKDEPMAILLGPREYIALCCACTCNSVGEYDEIATFQGYPVKLKTERGIDLVVRRCHAAQLAREAYGQPRDQD